MARINAHQTAYTAIRIEGGLIPAGELARLATLAQPEATEQTESHYGTPRGLKLRDEIARYFKIAQSLWQEFQSLRQRSGLDTHATTVNSFLLPLLRDALGYTDLARSAGITSGDHTYQIGHAAIHSRLPVVLAAHDQPLDQAAERFGDTNPETGRTRRRSPFMLAQEALNASDQSLWALVSNGLKLRILRDNPSLTRPAYVEIDLEAIFTEELYADFAAFWLLAHASRFGKPSVDPTEPAQPADCPWERWRKAGQDAGVTVRMNLRYQVADALRALGTGFLSHPANTHLREVLQNQEHASAAKQAFFDDLLRLVYRFIFLATVEDRTDPATGRSLIFTPDAADAARHRYRTGYSLTWLRERAARASSFDTHSDLWQALSITFDGLAKGQPALGLPALGGLFGEDQFQSLAHTQIENRHLLAAVFQLGYFRQSAGLTRVNYRDMGAEELGSVYESLLELVPNLQNLAQPHAARLTFVGDADEISDESSTKGNARKLTGSYYTPDSLVQELIKSALEPVIHQTVQANPDNPVDALLQLTVCDPACGSGHFLLAAARRLADEVAKLRAAQNGGAPSPADYRHALRDVVGHCIYGVDKNPMAIQLAKTALWLEAYTPDRPLTFIDHHLQVGDALLGVLDPKILENGIPDEAYAVLSGDDKAVASALKKQNKADLKSWKAIAANDLFAASSLSAEANAIEHLADDTLDGIAAKRSAWAKASSHARHSTLARLADTYVAAFLAPKVASAQQSIPLSGYLWALMRGQGAVDADKDSAADHLCRSHGVFHWWLAFPQVAAKGGFAVMLGNPPWEMLQLDPQEFFAAEAPSIANAQHMAARDKMIRALEIERPHLYRQYWQAVRATEAVQAFVHSSGRFPYSGFGRINLASLFAETILQASSISLGGRAGVVLPSGIATDSFTQHLFNEIARRGLASLYDFENREAIFPGVHRSYKFCLLTMAKTQTARFQFFAGNPSHLADTKRQFSLTPADFELLNPNTRTCPVFRSNADAELTKKLYRSTPVLWHEAEVDSEGQVVKAEVNPWNIQFQLMFMMNTDSTLFKNRPAKGEQAPRLPLYEAKMIHQFDHRWATYVDAPDKPDGLDTQDVNESQKADPAFAVRPRYWVEEAEVLARIACVPSRVASAWLAWSKADSANQVAGSDNALPAESSQLLVESRQALIQALAAWVAGELFRRAAGPATEPEGWKTATAWSATQSAEAQLSQQHPALAQALAEQGISGKKALPAFTKWALQDDPAQGLALSDTELDELNALQTGSQQSENAIKSIASRANFMPVRGQFGLNFAWLDVWVNRRSPKWLMGWRDICRSTDERTVIASVFGRAGVGNKIPLIFPAVSITAALSAALLGNLSALVFDFVARQKIGGTTLNYFYMKQFPVLAPSRYSELDLAFIVPRVLELTHTAHDMQPWADDLAAYDARPIDHRQTPFPWNPERRAHLRAELDAYYARLYGLTRDELRYILDPASVMGEDYPSETFRVLKNSEMKAYGEYRTQRLVLAAWDKWVDGESVEAVVSSPIYSAQGVISSPEEGDFAGLVIALIQCSNDGISVAGLQDVVAHASLASSYLEPSDAARLVALKPTVTLLAESSALPLIAPIVQRLESVGSISRKYAAGSSLYFAAASPVPSDVVNRHEHLEMAQLMLKLEANRALSHRTEADETESAPSHRAQGAS